MRNFSAAIHAVELFIERLIIQVVEIQAADRIRAAVVAVPRHACAEAGTERQDVARIDGKLELMPKIFGP